MLANRRKPLRLMLLLAAALGSSSAAVSGTLAAFSYAAERAAESPAVRPA